MRESQRDSRLRSFAARFGQDSGRSAPCVQPKTPDGHQRENVRSARDVSPRSVQFSVAIDSRNRHAGNRSTSGPTSGRLGQCCLKILTGKRAFAGDDVSLTLAKVLEREPSWESLPDTTPAYLCNVLQRCLEKESRQRVQAIGDVRLAMAGAFETATRAPSDPATVPRLAVWQRPIPLTLMVMAVAVLTGLGVWGLTRQVLPAPEPPMRFDITFPTHPVALTSTVPRQRL